MVRRRKQGPSRPIGRDTEGKFVFPTELDVGVKPPFRSPEFFPSGGRRGGVPTSGGGAGGRTPPPPPSPPPSPQPKPPIIITSPTSTKKTGETNKQRNLRVARLSRKRFVERAKVIKDIRRQARISGVSPEVKLRQLRKETTSIREIPSTTISNQPFFEEKQTGTFTAPDGTVIPKVQLVLVDPNTNIERKATASEISDFQRFKVLQTTTLISDRDLRAKNKLDRDRERIRQKQLRGGKLTSKELLILASFTFFSSVGGAFIGLKQLPSSLVSIAKNPSQLKSVPSALRRGLRGFGRLIRVSPTEVIVKIGTEILLLKGIGRGVRIVGKYGRLASARLNPRFRGIKNQRITIPSVTRGKKIQIKVGGTVKKIQEPLTTQLGLEGKSVTAVSAQADELVNILRTQKIVRKPLPNEANLTKRTRSLLSKFDKRKISVSELKILLRNVRKETGSSLLERSFFADPRGRFRPSRLGTEQKEAKLLDILTDDITFKTSKPQILIFEDVKIQKLPSTKIFQSIRKKLRTNKTLTEAEANALLKFQLKKGGKFKPLGAISKEPEITLAPGEIIKKVKKVGVTIINGKKVSIIQAKVIKPSKITSNLIKKVKSGKATKKEANLLKNRLRKETGFKPQLSGRARLRPRVSVRRAGISVGLRARRGARRRRRIKRRGITRRTKPTPRRPTRRPISRKTAPRKRITRRKTRPPVRPPKRPPKRPPIRPTGRPPVRPIPRRKKRIFRRKKKKAISVFNVFGKSRGKFVKLNVKPLTKRDALSRGAFAVDNTTAKTFKIKSVGKSKRPGPLRKGERSYFSRNRRKLRQAKIRRGKKIRTTNRFIEKRRFGIDTKGEKSGLTIARFLRGRKKVRRKNRPQRRTIIKRTRRTLSPFRRTQMLRNLKKAREIKKKKGGRK